MNATAAPLLGEALPIELMNTVWADREGVHDALATPGETESWLRAVADRLGPWSPGLADWLAAPHPDDLTEAADRLRILRDALRRLAAESTGDPRAEARSLTRDRRTALAVLAATCAEAPTWSSLTWDDGDVPHREVHGAAPPGRIVAARLAEEGIELFGGNDRARLRACLAPGCVLYFLRQHPRREWCSAGCGNRARVARHYRRHHALPDG